MCPNGVSSGKDWHRLWCYVRSIAVHPIALCFTVSVARLSEWYCHQFDQEFSYSIKMVLYISLASLVLRYFCYSFSDWLEGDK